MTTCERPAALPSTTRRVLVAAGLFGLLGVAAGAFGAHALAARLTPQDLAIWHTASEYQLLHAAALLGLAALPDSRALRSAFWCWSGGILVFSGSLYLLVLTGVRKLGMVTPIGGLLFLAGWAALVAAGCGCCRKCETGT